jgi:hypothetical protein
MGILHIYNVYTFKENLELKFKFGKMQHFVWLGHDQFIASCSNSGNVCVWNILNGQCLYEYIEKRTCFNFLIADLNELALYIVALDRMNNIRVLEIKNDKKFQSDLDGIIEDLVVDKLIETKKILAGENEIITCIQCFKNVIFFGDSKGNIKLYDLNSENLFSSEKTNHLYHSSSICQLFLIEKNGKPCLISCSENGLMILSNLTTKYILTNESKTLHKEWIDHVLITKSEIVKKLKYEMDLKETLFEQESEQKNKINLTEILHQKEIKEINYEAKMNLTRLRIMLKELNTISDDQEEAFAIKLKTLTSKFVKIQENIKEGGEEKLIQSYKLNTFLNHKKLEVFHANEELKRKLEDLKKEFTELNECKVYEEYEMYKIEQEYSFKIRNYRKTIELLVKENEQMEIDKDESIQILKNKFKEILNLFEKTNEDLKKKIYFDKIKFRQLKDKLENLKENERNFDENFNSINKKYLAKFLNVENLKKCLAIKKHTIDTASKSLLTIDLKRKKYTKINSFQTNEEKHFEKKLPILKSENEKLINTLQDYEEKLIKIVSSKIRLYKRIDTKSSFKHEKFNRKLYSQQQIKTKKLIEYLEKFKPNKKRLINKLRHTIN